MLTTARSCARNRPFAQIALSFLGRRKVIAAFLLAALTVSIFSRLNAAAEVDYAAARSEMVKGQLVARGIKDARVLDAMSWVERDKFVPENMQKYAYEDTPLPIGEGQTISQPYVVALMTELLELQGDEKVLEIGTGSGYQAAILAELAKEVYTIEIIEDLGRAAEERLKGLGYTNIKVKIADGYYGWEEYAPFDAIVVTAAAAYIPEPLIEQLNVGGRLVMPVGDERKQNLLFVQKEAGGKLKKYEVTGVLFVPLTGEHPEVKPKPKQEPPGTAPPGAAEDIKWKRGEGVNWKVRQR